MPRPILLNKQSSKLEIKTNFGNTKLETSGKASDRTLLQKRSKKYVQQIVSLDHGTLTATQGFAELIERIKEEFGELGIIEYPLGIVSKCFLGVPYEVHILDLSGQQIVSHFKRGESLPAHLEKARILAMNNSYAMIEVYSNKMILVKEDGSTTKL